MVDYRDFRPWRLMEPRFRHIWLLLFWPVYGLYFYFIEWVLSRDFFYTMWSPLDDSIPFCELFVIPYLFWFFYMVGAHVYTFFVEVAAFRRMMYAIFLTFGLTCFIFVAFPTNQELRPETFARDNFLVRTMQWFYTTDTNTNVCPSLHVCGSFAAAFGFTDTKRFSTRGWKIFHYGMAWLISVSTVFVKQHSVIDTFWGLVMSGTVYVLVYMINRKHPKRVTA